MNLLKTVNFTSIPRSTKVLGLALAALLLTFLIQQIGGDPPNTVAPPAVPDDPREIIITSRDAPVVLRRESDQWYVGTDGATYPADAAAVERLLDQLRRLSRVPVVSDRGNLREYGLESPTVRTVVIRGGSGEELRVELGYSATAGDAVYGRYNGKREILRFPRALHNTVGTNSDDYREMVVVRFPEETIREIRIGSTQLGTITVKPGWTATGDDLEQLGPIPEERIGDLLRELASLAAIGFPPEDAGEIDRQSGEPGTSGVPTPAPGTPFATLEIDTAGGGRERISLYPPDRDRRFPGRSTTVEYPFYLPEWRVRRLLLGIEAYLQPFMEDSPPVM